jgi:hypothetical protein
MTAAAMADSEIATAQSVGAAAGRMTIEARQGSDESVSLVNSKWQLDSMQDWLRIPAKTITFSGSCRSLRPDDADHPFRLMAIAPERDNAGSKIIPLVVA